MTFDGRGHGIAYASRTGSALIAAVVLDAPAEKNAALALHNIQYAMS
jgi:hypothetical protein